MRAVAIEIAHVVLFELQAIDNIGTGVGSFFLIEIRRSRIFCDQQHAVAVRCPVELIYTLLEFGQLLRITAAAVEQPDLRNLVFAVRQHGKIAAIGAPPGAAGIAARRGHLNRITAVGRLHPDRVAGLILLEIVGCNRVRNVQAVRAHADFCNAVKCQVLIYAKSLLGISTGK